ncbi:MAG: MaoC family dehydratase [Methylovirgula sp.]
MTTLDQPPQLGEKFAPQPFTPCGMEELRRYAEASGDSNPIHLDPELARKAGLPGPPVHGMLLMSRFVPALALWRPDLKLIRLSNKFLRPIFIGEGGELSGRVAQVSKNEPTTYLLRLMMHNEKREIALLAEAVTIRQPVA